MKQVIEAVENGSNYEQISSFTATGRRLRGSAS